MARREITSQQRAWLDLEVADWQAQGFVTGEQADRILGLYETQEELADQQGSKALQVLMGLAAMLVGLGVLLLVGYNWKVMPAVVKLVIIFTAVLGTHATGFVYRFRRNDPRMSEVIFFLGCLFYGAGIFLTAQIFHLNSHYPDGVWWWAIGVIPFALCFETVLLHLLLVALLSLWCGMEIIGFGDLGSWFFFGRWGVIPNSALSLPLLALPGLAWGYYRKSVATVGAYVLLFTWWVILQPIAWDMEFQSIYFMGVVGALLILIAGSHESRSPFAIPYRLFGVLLAGGVLLPLSFYDLGKELSTREIDTKEIGQIVSIIVISLVVIYASVMRKLYRGRQATGKGVLLGELIREQSIAIAILGLMVLLSLWSLIGGGALLPTVLSNIAMLALAIWLIGLGLREDRGQPFAAGVLYFLMWAIVRYVDLFGGFGGMLGAAVLFFLCGGILFMMALYWRKRRTRHV